MKTINILIADDQTLMRDGLKTILDLEDDMKVVGIAENGLMAYEMAGSLKPDIVLMDIRMPVMNGVESTKRIKEDFPEIAVIMLTTFDDEDYIIQALSYGASGYLLKDIQGDKLIRAIRDMFSGSFIMPAHIASKLAARLSRIEINHKSGKDAFLEELSERERDIARMMINGDTNKQIASNLYITEGTVKNYISEIYAKLGTNDRTKAVIRLKGYMSG